MSNESQLKVVVQALGLYCGVHSLFSAFTGISRFITWRLVTRAPEMGDMRTFLMDPLIYAVFLLLMAWALLAKADWWAHTVAELSKPQKDTDIEEEPPCAQD